MQLINFEAERKRRLLTMKVRLPFTYRTHYFAIPGISEWVGIADMTNGMKIEYDDLGSSIKIHREEDRITEERE